eukprot:TRINITY_DN22064_c0_g1_i1.p1 TRINITY_DN22064_c0_g1~~TRINITY_DN22064_c0_g1_i1.p1  ORF type:complete len:159 (+),score=38.93 TRINITY_DN22064_c0_g1_i1:111-587(+)
MLPKHHRSVIQQARKHEVSERSFRFCDPPSGSDPEKKSQQQKVQKEQQARPAAGKLKRLAEGGNPKLQDILRQVAAHLAELPSRHGFVSRLGQLLSADARAWLKRERLGLSTVLESHRDDFVMVSIGQKAAVVYLHSTAERTFRYAEQCGTYERLISL